MQRKASENNNLSPPPMAKVAKTGDTTYEYPNVPGIVVDWVNEYGSTILKILRIIRSNPDKKWGRAMLLGGRLWILKYPMFICVGLNPSCSGVFGITHNISNIVSPIMGEADANSDPSQIINSLIDDFIAQIINGPSAQELRTYLLNIYYKVSIREYPAPMVKKNKELMVRKFTDEFPALFENRATTIDYELLTKAIKAEFEHSHVEFMKYVSEIRKTCGATDDCVKFHNIVTNMRAHKEAFNKLFEFSGLNRENIAKLMNGLHLTIRNKYKLDANLATLAVLPLYRDDINDQEFLDKFVTKFAKFTVSALKYAIAGIKKLTSEELYKEGLKLEWENEEAIWKKCLDDIKVYVDAIDKAKNN